MENIVFKPMETEDEKIGRGYVHYKSWRETYTGLIDGEYLEKITLESRIQIAINNPTNTIIAKAGEKVVGFVCYCPYRSEEIGACGEIVSLYVLKEYQNRKIGYELMNRALVELSGYDKIALWVLKDNEKAIRFYEKYGFKFDGREMDVVLGTPNKELRMIYTR